MFIKFVNGRSDRISTHLKIKMNLNLMDFIKF